MVRYRLIAALPMHRLTSLTPWPNVWCLPVIGGSNSLTRQHILVHLAWTLSRETRLLAQPVQQQRHRGQQQHTQLVLASASPRHSKGVSGPYVSPPADQGDKDRTFFGFKLQWCSNKTGSRYVQDPERNSGMHAGMPQGTPLAPKGIGLRKNPTHGMDAYGMLPANKCV